MYTVLVVLISLLAVLLCVIILLQSGKGGGLAATFGGASSSTDSFMGGRQAATVLTKATWVGGGVFLFLGLVLAVLSSQQGQPSESILRDGMGPSNQVPQSPSSVLESEAGGEAGGQLPPLQSEPPSGAEGEGSGAPGPPGGAGEGEDEGGN